LTKNCLLHIQRLFVSFIKVFKQVREVGHQRVCAIW